MRERERCKAAASVHMKVGTRGSTMVMAVAAHGCSQYLRICRMMLSCVICDHTAAKGHITTGLSTVRARAHKRQQSCGGAHRSVQQNERMLGVSGKGERGNQATEPRGLSENTVSRMDDIRCYALSGMFMSKRRRGDAMQSYTRVCTTLWAGWTANT